MKEAGPRWYIKELLKHHKEAQLLALPYKVVGEKLWMTSVRGQEKLRMTSACGQESRQFAGGLLSVSYLLSLSKLAP